MSEPRRPLRTRRRPVFSCEECRRRKIKCDRTYPSKHCQQSNAVCNYSEGATPLNRQITPAASLDRTVEPPTPIAVIPTASLSLGNLSISSIRDECPQQPPQKSWKLPTAYEENTEDSPKVRALLEKVQRLEQLLSEYMPDGVLGNLNPPISIEPRAQLRGTLSKTRFYGQSHWMSLIGLVRLIGNLSYTEHD
jgi:hypothetical protein